METNPFQKKFLKIKYKLLIAFLILGILPFAILGIISFNYSGKVLTARAFGQLESIRDVKKAQMERYFAEKEKNLKILSNTVISLEQGAYDKLNTVQENKRAHLVEYLEKIFSDVKVLSHNYTVTQAIADFSSTLGKDGLIDTELYHFFEQIKYGQSLSQFKYEYNYQDLMLLNPSGDIIFTLNREKDLGENLNQGLLNQTAAALCFNQAKDGINFQDFSPYPPSEGQYLAFAGAPIKDKNQQLIGVVMLKINNNAINRIIQARLGMGKSGETYLLGNVSQIPEYRSDRVVKKGKIGMVKRDPHIREARIRSAGPFLRKGSTGEMEIARYDFIQFADLDWMVATSMALEEAISPNLTKQEDYFNLFSKIHNIADIYLIATNGDVFYSVSHEQDYGTNLVTGPYTDSGLATLFHEVMGTSDFQFIDFSPYAPINGKTAAFLGIPVIRNERPQMVIALRFSFDPINAMMKKETGIGKTGNIYLVGPDQLMRSDSFLHPDTHSADASFKDPSRGNVQMETVQKALKDEKGVMITHDYVGRKVLSAFTPINVWGETWALIAEINENEALAYLDTLKKISLLVAIFSIGIIVIISLIIARHFGRPISQLTHAARMVKDQNFDISVDIQSNDEMELMAETFNAMVKEIRHYSEDLNAKVFQLETTESELKKTNSQLTAVLEGTTDAVFIKDLEGRYLLANTGTCRALGKSLEEILGKDDSELFPENSVKVINDVDQEVISTGKTRLSEERLETAYGDSYWMSNKSPYRNRDGKIIGIIGISRNITQLKMDHKEKEELTAQLEQAHKMEAIGTLAGGIAHDFNNILAAIIGYTEIVQDELDKSSPEKGYTDEILKATQRARLLVKQILTFSRKSDQVKMPIKLDQILNEVLKLLRATIPTTIEIKTNLLLENAVIMAEATQIHQVIMNVCTNASQAIEDDKGWIEIGLDTVDLEQVDIPKEPDYKSGPYVKFWVKDNGIGISPDIIKRVFDPYFTTKGVGKGSGMGLAVVHGIVKSHNGYISVDSRKGSGTCVSIYFPKMDREDQTVEQIAAQSVSGTARILFVDDEPDILKVSGKRLERLGYTVTTFSNSVKAFEIFKTNPDQFDVLITDQTMPHLTGAELAEKIMKIRPDMPVILCTGYSAKLNKESAKRIGIRKFLFKPVESSTLTRAIQEVVKKD